MEFKNKRVHFIGIGGVSMSALSKLLEHLGAIISGSDLNIGSGHLAKNITRDIDLVIINGAIDDDNVELKEARKFGISVIGRDDLLGIIESKYPNRIAVAGTHGKSTTTAMIAEVMIAGGLNPTVHNGAKPNLVIGGDKYFITEACEFKRSFYKLNPTVAVVTNIDLDHTDCYKNLEEMQQAFKIFTQKAQFVVYNGCNDVIHNIKLRVPGKHNIQNANLAVKVGRHFGIPFETIKNALESFTGIERRFQFLGKFNLKYTCKENSCETIFEQVSGNGVDVICDFAHHPVEIATTIESANELYGQGNYLIVYQPHTYTRTISFFYEFCNELKKANTVLYKTYSAREKPIIGGTAKDIADAINSQYFDTRETLLEYLSHVHYKYNAIILTGAGDIDKVLNNVLY